MSNVKENCEEFKPFVLLGGVGAYSFVGFFFVVGLMMAVMTVSFGLLLHIFEYLWVAKAR